MTSAAQDTTATAPLAPGMAADPLEHSSAMSNLPVAVTPAPLAPVQMPAQTAPAGKYPWWAPYALGGLLGLQFLGPYEVRPTTVVGGIMADWVRQTTSASIENQLLLAKSQQIAAFIAETEASYSHKNGQCELTILLGPQAVALCKAAVDQYHKPALRDARERLGEIEAQLRRRR